MINEGDQDALENLGALQALVYFKYFYEIKFQKD